MAVGADKVGRVMPMIEIDYVINNIGVIPVDGDDDMLSQTSIMVRVGGDLGCGADIGSGPVKRVVIWERIPLGAKIFDDDIFGRTWAFHFLSASFVRSAVI